MNEHLPMILMIEDNPGVLKLNRIALERKGLKTRIAPSLEKARAELARGSINLILLDILLPDGNGLEFIPEIRQTTNAPILMLTSLRDHQDVINGLLGGADDYMTKPYRIEELYARIIAMLRREERNNGSLQAVTRGLLTLDTISGRAFLNGGDMLLSQKEFALLLVLMQNEGEVLSKEQLYEKIWNISAVGDTRVVKTHLSNVRRKLEGSGFTVTSTRGEGYTFEHIPDL